ncbi:discoidin domain-containing receptor 2 [Platysternon megacephalum]|uniref:Discoidin domain-containing receptor 2 n=1 Tax=Platysternon megacephalum TaxID=55544 RepID=A0A4D9E0D5_9SAUR|nr:discoidin domain-containing receptor 2 [Platysternon megacephalum]
MEGEHHNPKTTAEQAANNHRIILLNRGKGIRYRSALSEASALPSFAPFCLKRGEETQTPKKARSSPELERALGTYLAPV